MTYSKSDLKNMTDYTSFGTFGAGDQQDFDG